MITAVVTSDNHLGVNYQRLRPDRLEKRRQRLQAAFGQVVDTAIARKADLFLHAGDLFDRPDPRNADRTFVAQQVQRLREAEIPVYAIAGNHDSPRSYGYDGAGAVVPQEELHALNAVHLFRNNDALKPETRFINGQRVCVWGKSSDFNLAPDTCPLEETAGQHQRGGDIDLVLLHYGVEGWARPLVQEPCLSLASLGKLQADAICVGHLHARTEMRLPNNAALLNPGATEHIHFGEEKHDCGFWVLHCEPGNVRTEYVPLTPQPMRTLDLDLTDLTPEIEPNGEAAGALLPDENLHPLTRNLLDRILRVSHAEQLLRVRLTGRLPRALYQEIDQTFLQNRGSAANFHCQLGTESLGLYDPTEGWNVYVGSGFDVRQELEGEATRLVQFYSDDLTEQEICRLAGQVLSAAHDRLTGAAR